MLSLLGGGFGACEDEEAEGAIERDLVLEVYDVGVDDAGDVAVGQDAACSEFGGVGDE